MNSESHIFYLTGIWRTLRYGLMAAFVLMPMALLIVLLRLLQGVRVQDLLESTATGDLIRLGLLMTLLSLGSIGVIWFLIYELKTTRLELGASRIDFYQPGMKLSVLWENAAGIERVFFGNIKVWGIVSDYVAVAGALAFIARVNPNYRNIPLGLFTTQWPQSDLKHLVEHYLHETRLKVSKS